MCPYVSVEHRLVMVRHTAVAGTTPIWSDVLILDPACMVCVFTSEVPRELIQQARGGEVNLNLEDHRHEDYVKPRTVTRAFTGEGHRLGWCALLCFTGELFITV